MAKFIMLTVCVCVLACGSTGDQTSASTQSGASVTHIEVAPGDTAAVFVVSGSPVVWIQVRNSE